MLINEVVSPQCSKPNFTTLYIAINQSID